MRDRSGPGFPDLQWRRDVAVIWICFGRRVQITQQAWLDGAQRCEREAIRQEETAAQLRRAAARYAAKAAEQI